MVAGHIAISQEALLLAQSPFLAHIEPTALERLVPHIRRKHYSRGEVVYHRGDLPGDAFFIVRGMVKGRVESEDGRELIYWVWTRGGSFGIYDIYQDLRHNVDVVALEPTDVFAVAAQRLIEFMTTDPQWLTTALINYSRSIRVQFERLQDIVFLPGRERLCKAIVQYAVDEPRGETGAPIIKRPMSQSQLAAFTGNSRESVNRWLKGLARQGIIRLEKGDIIVLQLDELRKQYTKVE